MRLRNYLVIVLLYCCMLPVHSVQKMTSQRSRIDINFGTKEFNGPRDNFNFGGYVYTVKPVDGASRFFTGNKGGSGNTTTLDAKVELEPAKISNDKSVIFRIPTIPNVGIRVKIYDAKLEGGFYGYDNNQWNTVFSYKGNNSTSQGLKVWGQLVLIDTPDKRVYAANTYYSTEEILVGYVRANSYNPDGSLYAQSDPVPIYINPFTAVFNIASCTYFNGRNLVVNLPTVSTRSFTGSGSEVFGGTFTLDLGQCGVLREDGTLVDMVDNLGNLPLSSVWVTFTDATDPSNRTDKLTLTDSSTATGVKLKIYPASDSSMNVNAIKFGADSRLKGNENSIQMNYNTSTRAVNQRYIVKYVQDSAQVTPGSVNAIATFTFSYQ